MGGVVKIIAIGVKFMQNAEEADNKCGTVTVTVYKDKTGQPYFTVTTDTDDVLPVSYVIEDTLYLY